MSSSEDPGTIPNRADVEVETARVSVDEMAEIFERDPSLVPAHASFWCISLTVVEAGIQMVINLSGDIILGRLADNNRTEDFIDLTGYKAHEYGVSRKHALLGLRDNKVVIKDNNSANQTLLNNKKLRPLQEYPLKAGDIISLGKLELKFNLLFDPFSF